MIYLFLCVYLPCRSLSNQHRVYSHTISPRLHLPVFLFPPISASTDRTQPIPSPNHHHHMLPQVFPPSFKSHQHPPQKGLKHTYDHRIHLRTKKTPHLRSRIDPRYRNFRTEAPHPRSAGNPFFSQNYKVHAPRASCNSLLINPAIPLSIILYFSSRSTINLLTRMRKDVNINPIQKNLI